MIISGTPEWAVYYMGSGGRRVEEFGTRKRLENFYYLKINGKYFERQVLKNGKHHTVREVEQDFFTGWNWQECVADETGENKRYFHE